MFKFDPAPHREATEKRNQARQRATRSEFTGGLSGRGATPQIRAFNEQLRQARGLKQGMQVLTIRTPKPLAEAIARRARFVGQSSEAMLRVIMAMLVDGRLFVLDPDNESHRLVRAPGQDSEGRGNGYSSEQAVREMRACGEVKNGQIDQNSDCNAPAVPLGSHT